MGYAMPGQSDLAPSSFVEKPGWFHVAVNDFDPEPTKKGDGSMLDSIKLDLGVLDGTEPSQKKRQFTAYFNNPNMSHRDGGAFCWSVQVRLAMCLGGIYGRLNDGREVPIEKIPAGTEFDIVWVRKDAAGNEVDSPRGRQIVVKLVARKEREGFEIDGKHIYHPADPEVKDVPKDAASLKLAGITLPTGNNGGASNQQQKPANTPNGNGGNGGSTKQQQSAPANTVSNGPDLAALDSLEL